MVSGIKNLNSERLLLIKAHKCTLINFTKQFYFKLEIRATEKSSDLLNKNFLLSLTHVILKG